MKGNPHAESVNNGIQNVRDLIGKREMYQRDGQGIILEAQSRMAVAHEVRTLALVNLLASGAVYDTEYEDLLHEVRRGLGHGA
jgi:hypothetical protein